MQDIIALMYVKHALGTGRYRIDSWFDATIS